MHVRQCMRGNSWAGTLIEPLSGRQHQSYLQDDVCCKFSAFTVPGGLFWKQYLEPAETFKHFTIRGSEHCRVQFHACHPPIFSDVAVLDVYFNSTHTKRHILCVWSSGWTKFTVPAAATQFSELVVKSFYTPFFLLFKFISHQNIIYSLKCAYLYTNTEISDFVIQVTGTLCRVLARGEGGFIPSLKYLFDMN